VNRRKFTFIQHDQQVRYSITCASAICCQLTVLHMHATSDRNRLRRHALSKRKQKKLTKFALMRDAPVRLRDVQLVFAITAAAASACCGSTVALKTAASAARNFYIIVL
jgi:hypothetical protein